MNKGTIKFNLVSKSNTPEEREKFNIFSGFVKLLHEQDERRIAAARDAVANSKVPLDDEVRRRLLELRSEDVLGILRLHPGCKASEALKSMKFAISLFNKSISDYIVCAEQFCSRSCQAGFLDKVNDKFFDELNLSVAKEIYAVSFYSKMLVDQARRLRSAVSVDGYDEMLKTTISTTNAHSFIVELRNMVSHELVIPHGFQCALVVMILRQHLNLQQKLCSRMIGMEELWNI